MAQQVEQPVATPNDRIEELIQLCNKDKDSDFMDLLGDITEHIIKRNDVLENHQRDYSVSLKGKYDNNLKNIASSEYLNFSPLNEVIESKFEQCRADNKKTEEFCTELECILNTVWDQVDAAQSEFQKLVKYEMMKLDPLDTVDLWDACKKGRLLAVKYWLNREPSLIEAFQSEDYLFTPLHCAVIHDHADIVEYLLSQRADVNKSVPNNQMRALHFAGQHANVPVVQILLNSGADVNAVDVQNQTPLHWGVRGGNMEVVKTLCNSKANLFAKSSNLLTPAEKAKLRGLETIGTYLEDKMEEEQRQKMLMEKEREEKEREE